MSEITRATAGDVVCVGADWAKRVIPLHGVDAAGHVVVGQARATTRVERADATRRQRRRGGANHPVAAVGRFELHHRGDPGRDRGALSRSEPCTCRT